MKKVMMFLMAGVVALAFTATVQAGSGEKISGEVTKVDGEFVEIKDAEGGSQKFHMDKTTKIMGELKVGALVEVENHDGHAMSVTAAAPAKDAAMGKMDAPERD